MNLADMRGELESLARKLDVEVRYDNFTGDGLIGGGLCKIRGQWRVIVERRMSEAEKVGLIAGCLARFDTEDHFISPAVRKTINRYRIESS